MRLIKRRINKITFKQLRRRRRRRPAVCLRIPRQSLGFVLRLLSRPPHRRPEPGGAEGEVLPPALRFRLSRTPGDLLLGLLRPAFEGGGHRRRVRLGGGGLKRVAPLGFSSSLLFFFSSSLFSAFPFFFLSSSLFSSFPVFVFSFSLVFSCLLFFVSSFLSLSYVLCRSET